MTQQTFNLQQWVERHEFDHPKDLERALQEVPSEQRTLALLTWLHDGDLHGERIQVPLR